MSKAEIICKDIVKMSTAKIRYVASGKLREHRQCNINLPKDVASKYSDGQQFVVEMSDDLVIILTPLG